MQIVTKVFVRTDKILLDSESNLPMVFLVAEKEKSLDLPNRLRGD